MKSIIKSSLCLLCALLVGCRDVPTNLNYNLDAVYGDAVNDEKIMAPECDGQWKLVQISGGFSGGGYTPDFDYMEIKCAGIYGLIKDNVLFEYGRIEKETFDPSSPDLLQVKLIPEYHSEPNPYMDSAAKYLEVKENVLTLNSQCCDFYNFRFERMVLTGD